MIYFYAGVLWFVAIAMMIPEKSTAYVFGVCVFSWGALVLWELAIRENRK